MSSMASSRDLASRIAGMDNTMGALRQLVATTAVATLVATETSEVGFGEHGVIENCGPAIDVS